MGTSNLVVKCFQPPETKPPDGGMTSTKLYRMWVDNQTAQTYEVQTVDETLELAVPWMPIRNWQQYYSIQCDPESVFAHSS